MKDAMPYVCFLYAFLHAAIRRLLMPYAAPLLRYFVTPLARFVDADILLHSITIAVADAAVIFAAYATFSAG